MKKLKILVQRETASKLKANASRYFEMPQRTEPPTRSIEEKQDNKVRKKNITKFLFAFFTIHRLHQVFSLFDRLLVFVLNGDCYRWARESELALSFEFCLPRHVRSWKMSFSLNHNNPTLQQLTIHVTDDDTPLTAKIKFIISSQSSQTREFIYWWD